MVKKIGIYFCLCAGARPIPAQQLTTFAGHPSAQYDIAPNLSVYASECKYEGEPAICYDVSYGRIASAGRALLSIAGGVASGGDAGTVGNILDEAPHNGTLFITASKVAFVPETDAPYAWIGDRSWLTVKHQKNWGEEIRCKPQSLHGVLNFRPRDSNGQFAWSDGSFARVLASKTPEGAAGRFLEDFNSSIADFASSYARFPKPTGQSTAAAAAPSSPAAPNVAPAAQASESEQANAEQRNMRGVAVRPQTGRLGSADPTTGAQYSEPNEQTAQTSSGKCNALTSSVRWTVTSVTTAVPSYCTRGMRDVLWSVANSYPGQVVCRFKYSPDAPEGRMILQASSTASQENPAETQAKCIMSAIGSRTISILPCSRSTMIW